MDTRDGSIRRLEEGERPNDHEIVLDKMPDKNCAKCRGLGYTTSIFKKRGKLPCECTIDMSGRIKTLQERLKELEQ